MTKRRYKEITVHENHKGKIVKIVDSMLGRVRYVLCDRNGGYVKEIKPPFKATEYL